MPISDDVYTSACDSTVDTKEWISHLRDTYLQRQSIHEQTNQFYLRRRLVEYSVKTTVTASMAVAMIWGGPPFWIISGAALILKFNTLILNRFNPSQYIEKSIYQSTTLPSGSFEDDRLEIFRREWREGHDNYFFKAHEKELCNFQKRIAFTLTAGFLIFTLLNASLTLPILIASTLFAGSFIQQAKEIPPPYLEEEENLSKVFIK